MGRTITVEIEISDFEESDIIEYLESEGYKVIKDKTDKFRHYQLQSTADSQMPASLSALLRTLPSHVIREAIYDYTMEGHHKSLEEVCQVLAEQLK